MLRRAKLARDPVLVCGRRRGRVGSNVRPPAALLAGSVAVALTLAAGSAAAATSRCTLAKIADLPVRIVRNKLVVDGAVNGQPVGIMLDTGATSTLITRPAADRLGLIRKKTRGRMYGMGGVSEVESALVDEFRVGDATAKSRYMMVTGEREIGDGIAVILGEDFFHVVDVEFDLAHNAVRLFRPKDCDGSSLAYWATGGASEIPIERVAETRPSIVLTVQINGQPVRALLDSGSSASVLNRSDAERTGVTAQGSGGTGGGLGPSPVDYWYGSVNSIAIGDENIKDTRIEVADLWKGTRFTSGSVAPPNVDRPSMFLGVDFLRAHRVMIAHSQQKLYFTYLGGSVFQGRDPADARGDPDRAIADNDAAIRSDPQNAMAYFRRGNAWYEKKDYDRAIADYDAVIRIEPGKASAYGNRGAARLAQGDYAQAIADATRALEMDARLSSAFMTRGVAKGRSGDLDGAIADWTRALELDQGLPQAYNHLAWAWATAERPTVRDGRRAVESALKACELTQWKNPSYLDTLAAAYARNGQFDEAVKWQRKAMESPDTAKDDRAAERLRLYGERKAWPPD